MPNRVQPDPTPDWMKPENASVFDPYWKTIARKAGHVLGLDDPTTSVNAPLMTDVPGGQQELSTFANAVKETASKLPGVQRVTNWIRAYHGSPHDFDKFDLSKVGTGEGAAAYGHGLYLAGNEDVAREYRNSLARPSVTIGGQEHPMPSWSADLPPEQRLIRRLSDAKTLHPTPNATDAEVIARARQDLERELNAPYGNKTKAYQELELLKHAEAQGITVGPGGHIYEVNIHANPEHLLDWDRPLTEQSPHVQQALAGQEVRPNPVAWQWQPHQVTPADVTAGTFGPSASPGQWTVVQRDASGNIQYHSGSLGSRAQADTITRARQEMSAVSPRDRGENLYRDLQGVRGKAGASQLLNQAGVPGIQYLDQGSRAAGEGTRNYVMFDDKLIDILRKYGILAPLVGGTAASALSRPDNQVGTPPPVVAPRR